MKRDYGRSFTEDIKLDKYSLDDEMEMNPTLLNQYGSLYAEAKAEQDRLEVEVKYLTAKKDLFYRQNPPEGIKITESVINSLVEVDAEIVSTKEALNKAKEAVYTYYAAVDSLRDKGTRLHDLMELYKTGYYK